MDIDNDRALHRFDILSRAGLRLGSLPVGFPATGLDGLGPQVLAAHREVATVLRELAETIDRRADELEKG
jgi:hypothetical protein